MVIDAVLGGGLAEDAGEGTGEVEGVGKADIAGDERDRVGAGDQSAASFVEPILANILHRGATEQLATKDVQEGCADADGLGKTVNGERAIHA